MNWLTDGMKSSEFLMNLFVSLLGVALALNWIGPDEADQAQVWFAGLLQEIGALMVMVSNVGYSISRGIAKSKG